MSTPVDPVPPRRQGTTILMLMIAVAAVACLLGLWVALAMASPTRVSGVVIHQDRPLRAGVIVFDPVDPSGRKASGPIVGGRYAIDPGILPGTYAVGIRDDRGAIPAKYSLPSTSGLTVEITESQANWIDFNLR